MRNYLVHYSFTCPACGHKNLMRETTVFAADKINAASKAHAKATCTRCGEGLPPGHPFTTTISEL
jgi:predicted RNA-binding Zn-ribbon protein involved in translation (DUF1610 family)